MDNSIAIIRYTKSDFIAKNIEFNGFTVINAYKSSNYVSYLIWKTLKLLNLPGQSLWYNGKLKHTCFDTIILIESNLTVHFVNWIRKNNPNSRIVFWYWNIVENTINPSRIKDDSIEKWSFSEKDCEIYSMQYNPPFYFKNIKIEQSKEEYDLYFAGKDKGRLSALLDFKKKSEELGLNVYLHVSPTRKLDLIFNSKNLKPAISYDRVLEDVAKSKALLDIIEVTDSGQSQRTMESIFFEKKIVTNSKLIKKFDFYNQENIFVIGEDNIEKLPSFLKTPYVKIDENIINRYEVRNWVKRFLINQVI
ncbi:MAG: hypothetical protein CVU85_00335 [Firmicutes bacterium HGW-Firmicutes-10]|jgi:hypothetical protein|nr:MAG: hypothetical protein CVU85_00335 [Firmicutes bacterium HGW-Firmicutes-10]